MFICVFYVESELLNDYFVFVIKYDMINAFFNLL